MYVRVKVTKSQDENSRVKGYADLTLEKCCVLRGTRIIENDNGELFVSYPQKAVYENGQPKMSDGRQVYSDVYYGNSKEVNDAIKAAVLEAYNHKDGYAYINPPVGEHINGFIEPQLHACNTETVKAAGKLLVGDYMRVTDVFVSLRTTEEGDKLLCSYPHYKAKDDTFKYLVEPLEKGKRWDPKTNAEVDCNFRDVLERTIKKRTLEFHPELAEALKPTVQETIDEAKGAVNAKSSGTRAKSEPVKE